jgi:4-alpha-glucanotransferase
MNVPGTKGGNWQWRFRWDQLTPEIKQRMRALAEATGRIHD